MLVGIRENTLHKRAINGKCSDMEIKNIDGIE